MKFQLSLVLISVALSGCGLYFGGDDSGDDVVCRTPPEQLYRNPETGSCESFGGGGGGGCSDPCGPCDDYGDPRPGAYPQWPTCYGRCAGLDEYTCGGTPGCHIAYYDYYGDAPPPEPHPGDPDDPSGGGGGAGVRYAECWDIEPLPVNSYGDCWNLDAYSCAMADHCTSTLFTDGYTADGTSSAKFGGCAPESDVPYSCETIDCGYGYHCEEQCYPGMGCDPSTGVMCPPDDGGCYPTCVPDYNTCAATSCPVGYECVERCSGGGCMDPADPMCGGGGGMTPPGFCYAECVEIVNQPGECYGDVYCDSIPPACPSGTTPGVLNGCWTGYCIPTDDCGPSNPGGCEPADGTCLVGPPMCPPGSIPGTSGGCYTGYCIPETQCPNVPCEALTDERSCLSRMECTAVYTGDDCTCTPSGCSCTSQTYDHCETWWF